jgi:hypothetical protein
MGIGEGKPIRAGGHVPLQSQNWLSIIQFFGVMRRNVLVAPALKLQYLVGCVQRLENNSFVTAV